MHLTYVPVCGCGCYSMPSLTSNIQQQPDIVPHPLPDKASLEGLITGLPLAVHTYTDDPHLYCAVLQVPPAYALPAVVPMAAPVVRGAGRGSRQMGTPTANLDEGLVSDVLTHLPKGVYFGCVTRVHACMHVCVFLCVVSCTTLCVVSKLVAHFHQHRLALFITPCCRCCRWAQLPSDSPTVHKAVVNIGDRPTLNDGREATVEVHVLHPFDADFYGSTLNVVLTGFLRYDAESAHEFVRLLIST